MSDEKQKKNLLAQEHGKIPPQDTELEKYVLGAMLTYPDFVPIQLNILSESSFYKTAHQIIFSIIKKLSEANKPVNILSVTHELKASELLGEVGGVLYLTQITGETGTGGKHEYYSQVLNDLAAKRDIIRIGQITSADGYENDLCSEEIIEKTIKELEGTAKKYNPETPKTMCDIVDDVVYEIEEISKGSKKASGVLSSLSTINSITHGWQKSDLIIIAARPGMGKTAFVLGEVLAAARDGIPVLVFSLEMSERQLITRLLISIADIENEVVRSGKMLSSDLAALHLASEELKELPIFIDDTAGLTITQMRMRSKIMQHKHGIGMIALDYLQLMQGEGKGQNRESEISTISRGLKIIAKELNIPVIALSQLSRECEKRADKRPILSDLRESGAIEQDADIVMFIWRSDYYKKDGASDGGIVMSEAVADGYTEFNIAKHRNGAVNTVRAIFNEGTMTFVREKVVAPSYALNFNDVRQQNNNLPF